MMRQFGVGGGRAPVGSPLGPLYPAPPQEPPAPPLAPPQAPDRVWEYVSQLVRTYHTHHDSEVKEGVSL